MGIVGGIDLVANLFTPEVVASRPEWTKGFHLTKNKLPSPIVAGTPVEAMLEVMQANGFEHALLLAAKLGRRGLTGSWELDPQVVADVVAAHPTRFSGLYGINPYDGMAGVREMAGYITESGFVGAHVYPHWFEKTPDDPIYFPFYAKCAELGVPVQIQVGYCRVYEPEQRFESVGRPEYIDRIACVLPDLKIIGIHVGWPWTDEMIAVADKHDNVYIGTDRHPPSKWPATLVQYLSTWGRHKVLFGTDFPVVPFEVARSELDALNLDAGVLADLLTENTKRVYGLA